MPSKPAARQPDLRSDQQIMSSSEIERTLVRLAHEIIEKNDGAQDLALVGILKRGVPLAQRLAQMIQRIEKTPVAVGSLDTTLYRDDLSPLGPKLVAQKAEIGFSVTGKNIILVDDVLYTGRTMRWTHYSAIDVPSEYSFALFLTVAIANYRLRPRSAGAGCTRQDNKASRSSCAKLTTAREFFYWKSMTERTTDGGAGAPVRARKSR